MEEKRAFGKYENIAYLTATEMRNLMGRRELSPVDIAEACLAQVERYNGRIAAICTLSEDVLKEARKSELAMVKGAELGLLHGLPVGIKDVTPTAGIRTTFGSRLYADYIPKEDALIVRRLKNAGAIVLGKTNTPEFATGGNTFNEIFGYTRNPWNPKLSAGGSTGGGAAALASGMIALAEGTDLGGSMRIPASFCGVVGLRPSPGLIPTWPAEFLWDTLYITGSMARTVEDVALMLQAVCGPTPLDPLSQRIEGRNFISAVRAGIRGLRIAYCPDIAAVGVEEEIETICRCAAFDLREAGALVDEFSLNLSFAANAFLTLRGLWMVKHHFRHLNFMEHFGPNLLNNIKGGMKQTPEQIAAAEAARMRVWDTFHALFQRFDYLVTPCVSVSPFPVEENYPKMIAGKEMKTYIDWVAPTSLLSLVPLPVASVPCGITRNRLPVGLQIVGRPLGEESVLALGRELQLAHPIGKPEF